MKCGCLCFFIATSRSKSGAIDNPPRFFSSHLFFLLLLILLLVIFILYCYCYFKNFTGRFPGKCAVKWVLKIPPHLAYVATLPCETLMSAKQAINDKLQGNVAACLRCGGVVNKQIN